jgi:integrase
MIDSMTLLSIGFLQAVLAGKNYQDLGQDHGITGNAIRYRVRTLAMQLHLNGFLTDVNPKALNYINKLRSYKEKIEAALDQFVSNDASFPRIQRYKGALNESEIKSLLRRAGLRTATPLRDVALIHISLMTGLKPIEIARLRIEDYLTMDGKVREISQVRANIAYNHRRRPLFLTNKDSVSAINAYLSHRLGTQETDHLVYRGLNPKDFLFLNDAGKPFKVARRQGFDGNNNYTSKELVDTYNRILMRSDIYGMQYQVFRRTLARRMHERGGAEGQICIVLGIADRKNIRKMLPSPPPVDELMRDIFPIST